MSDIIYEDHELSNVISSIPKEELRHMQRVSRLVNKLSCILAQNEQYKTFEEELTLFSNAAFYHDIGKAWVPADILSKKEALTDEEYKLITFHPLFAQNFLDKKQNHFCKIEPLMHLIYNAAVYHHERYDGKGYPYGLKGSCIPLIARVTSVCDVYDAITYCRPYSPARTHEEACTEIERCAGSQLDPDIVRVFVDNKSVFETYSFCINAT